MRDTALDHEDANQAELWLMCAELCARFDEIIKRLPEPEPEGEE
jgi:hypothetical protein